MSVKLSRGRSSSREGTWCSSISKRLLIKNNKDRQRKTTAESELVTNRERRKERKKEGKKEGKKERKKERRKERKKKKRE